MSVDLVWTGLLILTAWAVTAIPLAFAIGRALADADAATSVPATQHDTADDWDTDWVGVWPSTRAPLTYTEALARFDQIRANNTWEARL